MFSIWLALFFFSFYSLLLYCQLLTKLQTALLGEIRDAHSSLFDRAVGRLPRLCNAGACIPLTNEAMTKWPKHFHSYVYIPLVNGTISKWLILFCPGAQHSPYWWIHRTKTKSPYLPSAPNPGWSEILVETIIWTLSLSQSPVDHTEVEWLLRVLSTWLCTDTHISFPRGQLN